MPAPAYPPQSGLLLRISQSKLELYLRCGLRYEFEEGQRGARFATVRMLIGSGVAVGAHTDNREKMTHGAPASLRTIIDAAVVGYEEEVEASEVPERPLAIERGKDDTAAAAHAYGTQVSPAIVGVLAAEEPLLATVRGIELAGTPDVVTGDGIGDTKTGQPWTQTRADRARQLTGYGVLHRIHFGRFPARVWIDSIAHVRGAWRAERLWSSRMAEDYSAFLHTVDRAVAGIRAGIALPAPEASWWCAPAWCPWWSQCPAVGNKKE